MSCRILYICGGRSFRRGASIPKIERVVRAWQAGGHEVEHVCGGDLEADAATATAKDFGHARHHRQWFRRSAWLAPVVRSLSERRDIVHDAALLAYLRRRTRTWRPDLVIERSSRLHQAGLLLARELQVPFVHEWKDNIAAYRGTWHGARARRLEQHKCHAADYVITESAVLRGQLAATGVAAEKIIVAHNAADPQRFRPDRAARRRARTAWGVDDETCVIGYLGSYNWYHRVDLLIEALTRMRRNRLLGRFAAVCIGAGREYDRVRRQAAQAGLLDGTLRLQGPVPAEAAAAWIAGLDVAVLPGSTEIICPIKVQEYLACQVATIAPDYACNREVIEHERSGWLFAAERGEALTEGLIRLVEEPCLRERLARAGRATIVERFTWERTWGAALDTILARTGLVAPEPSRWEALCTSP